MMRMQDDVTDCKREVNEEDVSEDEWMCARMLYLRNLYPRLSKQALWMLLVRYWFRGSIRRPYMTCTRVQSTRWGEEMETVRVEGRHVELEEAVSRRPFCSTFSIRL